MLRVLESIAMISDGRGLLLTDYERQTLSSSSSLITIVVGILVSAQIDSDQMTMKCELNEYGIMI